MSSNSFSRAKQIQEILNEDRDINLRVVDLQQKALQKYERDNAPLTTDDKQVVQGVSVSVESLQQLLSKKLIAVMSLPRVLSFLPSAHSGLNEALGAGEFLQGWNSVIRQYQQPTSSNNLKRVVHYDLMKLEANLSKMVSEMNDLLSSFSAQTLTLLREDRKNELGHFMKKALPSFCESLGVYKLALKLLDSGNFALLTPDASALERAKVENKSPVRDALAALGRPPPAEPPTGDDGEEEGDEGGEEGNEGDEEEEREEDNETEPGDEEEEGDEGENADEGEEDDGGDGQSTEELREDKPPPPPPPPPPRRRLSGKQTPPRGFSLRGEDTSAEVPPLVLPPRAEGRELSSSYQPSGSSSWGVGAWLRTPRGESSSDNPAGVQPDRATSSNERSPSYERNVAEAEAQAKKKQELEELRRVQEMDAQKKATEASSSSKAPPVQSRVDSFKENLKAEVEAKKKKEEEKAKKQASPPAASSSSSSKAPPVQPRVDSFQENAAAAARQKKEAEEEAMKKGVGKHESYEKLLQEMDNEPMEEGEILVGHQVAIDKLKSVYGKTGAEPYIKELLRRKNLPSASRKEIDFLIHKFGDKRGRMLAQKLEDERAKNWEKTWNVKHAREITSMSELEKDAIRKQFPASSTPRIVAEQTGRILDALSSGITMGTVRPYSMTKKVIDRVSRSMSRQPQREEEAEEAQDSGRRGRSTLPSFRSIAARATSTVIPSKETVVGMLPSKETTYNTMSMLGNIAWGTSKVGLALADQILDSGFSGLDVAARYALNGLTKEGAEQLLDIKEKGLDWTASQLKSLDSISGADIYAMGAVGLARVDEAREKVKEMTASSFKKITSNDKEMYKLGSSAITKLQDEGQTTFGFILEDLVRRPYLSEVEQKPEMKATYAKQLQTQINTLRTMQKEMRELSNTKQLNWDVKERTFMTQLEKINEESVRKALMREFEATKLAVENKSKNPQQEEAKKIEKAQSFLKSPEGRQYVFKGLDATKQGAGMTEEQKEELLHNANFVKGFADFMRYDFGGVLPTKSNVMEFNPSSAMSSTGYGKPRAKRKPRAPQ